MHGPGLPRGGVRRLWTDAAPARCADPQGARSSRRTGAVHFAGRRPLWQAIAATVGTQRTSLWRVAVGVGTAAKQAERIRVSTRGSTSPRRVGNDLLYLSNSEAGGGIWRNEGASVTEVWNPERGSVTGRIAVEPGGRRIVFPVRRDGAYACLSATRTARQCASWRLS